MPHHQVLQVLETAFKALQVEVWDWGSGSRYPEVPMQLNKGTCFRYTPNVIQGVFLGGLGSLGKRENSGSPCRTSNTCLYPYSIP